MRGVGYLADWQALSSYSRSSGASSFSKRYIPMKKSQCLFFTRSLFLSKSKPFWSKKWPFQRLKSCTKPIRVCSFLATFMLVRWTTERKALPSRFYFTNFICKEIGINFLYKIVVIKKKMERYYRSHPPRRLVASGPTISTSFTVNKGAKKHFCLPYGCF